MGTYQIILRKQTLTVRLIQDGTATLIEAVNYGAGLLKIPYDKFMIGFLLSHPLLGIPMFYFVNNIIKQENVLVTIALAIIGIFGVYLLRGRYFEYEQTK